MRLIWISTPKCMGFDTVYGACRDGGIMSFIDCEEHQLWGSEGGGDSDPSSVK